MYYSYYIQLISILGGAVHGYVWIPTNQGCGTPIGPIKNTLSGLGNPLVVFKALAEAKPHDATWN